MQLPLTARPEFAGSVVVYKATSLEAVWELVKGDPFYKEGVVRDVYLGSVQGLRAECGGDRSVEQGHHQDRSRALSGIE